MGHKAFGIYNEYRKGGDELVVTPRLGFFSLAHTGFLLRGEAHLQLRGALRTVGTRALVINLTARQGGRNSQQAKPQPNGPAEDFM